MQRSLLQRASVQPALMTVSNRDFAVSEKALRTRMKSVNSIRKITKAMKMVSASKMKADLRRLADGKNFGLDAVDMIFKSDQFMQRRMPQDKADPKTMLVPITSDKGLCGATNSTIVRQIKAMVKEAGDNRAKFGIFSIGDKGSAGLVRPFPDLLTCSIS